MEIKSDKEVLIELRNEISKRRQTYLANAIYFGRMMKKAKINTQEAVDAKNNVAQNEHSAKLDVDFLKVIDEMILNLSVPKTK